MTKRRLNGKFAWTGLAAVAVAAMLVPAALADKPAPKTKPIAAEKTWVKVGGGKGYGTYLALDKTFTDALAAATPAIAAAPLTPARVTPDGIRFPITQGKLILSYAQDKTTMNGVRGTIGHVGGLSLKQGDVTVRVRNFVIVANVATSNAVTTDTSKLTAQVNGKRIDFAKLTFKSFPTIKDRKVEVKDVEVTLTKAAADALNAAFKTTLTEGTPVGTAKLVARLVGKG